MMLTWRKTPIQLAIFKIKRWRVDRMTPEERHDYYTRRAVREARKVRADRGA